MSFNNKWNENKEGPLYHLLCVASYKLTELTEADSGISIQAQHNIVIASMATNFD